VGVGVDPVPAGVGVDPVPAGVGVDPVPAGVGVDPVPAGVGVDPVPAGVGVDPVPAGVGVLGAAGQEPVPEEQLPKHAAAGALNEPAAEVPPAVHVTPTHGFVLGVPEPQ